MARNPAVYDVSDTWRNAERGSIVDRDTAVFMATVENKWRTSIRQLAEKAALDADSAEARLGSSQLGELAGSYAVDAARYQAQQHGPEAVRIAHDDFESGDAARIANPILPPPLDEAGVSNPGSRQPLPGSSAA